MLSTKDIATQGQLQWSRPQVRTETYYAPKERNKVTMLQWSRPQVRTETSRLHLQAAEGSPASMEPSSGEDGDQEQCLRSVRPVACASMEPSSGEDGDETIRCTWH